MTIGKFGTPEKSRKLLAPGDECPDCGKPMRMRARRSDGKGFLGCSGYPECKHTENDFRDAPADYKAPEKKPYSPQAVADYKAKSVASVGEFTEFELGMLRDMACDKVKMNTDDVLLGIIVKLERCLEKFKVKTPMAKAMDDAVIPKYDGPQEEF